MPDLTTLANIKEYLGQSNTATKDDALLSKLITRASAFIVTYSSRDYVSQEYNESRSGNGSTRLILGNQDVSAVSSLTINGQSVPPGGSSETNGFWFDGRWVYVNGYRFALGFNNIHIVYTAGFATIPPDIEQVCIELVANKYKRKDRIGEDSKNLSGMVVSYSKTDLSQDHKDILNFYESQIPI